MVASVFGGFFFWRHSEPNSFARPQLRLITYNIQGAKPDQKQLLALLREQRPDLVLLQDTPNFRSHWLSEHLQLPYRYYTNYRHDFGGVAILSRWPMGLAQLLTFRDSEQGKVALAAPVYSPMGTLWVCSVHLESVHYAAMTNIWQYGTFLWKELFSTTPRYQQAVELQDWLMKLSPGAWIVAGDFNSFPFSRVDRYFSGTFDDALLHRPWRYLTGTYWDLPLGPVRPRIDYVYYSPRLHVLDAKVIQQKISDHFAVLAVFALGDTSAVAADSGNASASFLRPLWVSAATAAAHRRTAPLL
jgi:endonuclease/exonuclease/phosphatase (EEP) superfamily protein YafD